MALVLQMLSNILCEKFLLLLHYLTFLKGVSSIYVCYFCSALGTWVFSVAGALLAIPFGIKRKSFGPLVFFGTTGTMLDIIMGVTACEREHAERQMMLLEAAQNSAAANVEENASET